MLSTKGIIDDPWKIPSHWIFEFYCKLPEKLIGQDIKIKSVFRNEKTPSMCIYYKNGNYRFKDFSSGLVGSHVDFLTFFFNCPVSQVLARMLNDYNTYIINHGVLTDREFISYTRYRIGEYKMRKWTSEDAKYWMQFGIDSKTLNHYNVSPLDFYILTRDVDGETQKIIFERPHTYAYRRLDGTPYKIYQPKNTEKKFLKLADYIQVKDQLKFNQPNLIICSSLKDGMSLSKFGYNAEIVAPDSENSMISAGVMAMYKSRYKAICTLFDNDIAGATSAQKYKDAYNIPSVILPMSKDVADSVRDYTMNSTRNVLTPLLKEALKK